jgi:hypothetical protein
VAGVVEVVRTCGVVAQEIHRLAHLGDGVGQVLPASRTSSPSGRGRASSASAARSAARRRARAAASRPRWGAAAVAAASARPRRPTRGLAHLADDVAVIAGLRTVRNGVRRPASAALRPAWAVSRRGRALAAGLVRQRPQRARSARSSRRSWAPVAVQRLGQRDARVRRAQLPSGGICSTCATGSAISSSIGTIGVGDAVDEGGVGAVLQQAAHQVGQQRLVRADRRVDAAGPAQPVGHRSPPVRRAARPCRAGTGTRTGPAK